MLKKLLVAVIIPFLHKECVFQYSTEADMRLQQSELVASFCYNPPPPLSQKNTVWGNSALNSTNTHLIWLTQTAEDSNYSEVYLNAFLHKQRTVDLVPDLLQWGHVRTCSRWCSTVLIIYPVVHKVSKVGSILVNYNIKYSYMYLLEIKTE